MRAYAAALSLRPIRSSLIHAYRDRIAYPGSLQGNSFVRARPNLRARFFKAQCGMPTFLAKSRMPGRRFVSMVKIDLSDELVDLISKDVLAIAADLGVTCRHWGGSLPDKPGATGSRITVP